MKICSKCKHTKSLSEFPKNKNCKDGYLNNCKTCQRIYVAKYQKTIKGKIVHRRGVRKYRNTKKGQATIRRFNARYPNYTKAVKAISNAIQAGKLPRPDTFQCNDCPVQAKQYHHWHGYEKEHWFDVIPVCTQCHSKCKRKMNYGY